MAAFEIQERLWKKGKGSLSEKKRAEEVDKNEKKESTSRREREEEERVKSRKGSGAI